MRSIPFLLSAIIIASSCSSSKPAMKAAVPAEAEKPDYSRLESWAAHASKKDPSDKLPASIRNNYLVDTSVAVFFIHPTTFTEDGRTEWNAPIFDAQINKETDESRFFTRLPHLMDTQFMLQGTGRPISVLIFRRIPYMPGRHLLSPILM